MKKVLFIIGLLACMLSSIAENGTLRGNVIDSESGESVIGASVYLKGTTTGTTTDLDGSFLLNNIESGTYTLVCQYISYKTQESPGVSVEPDAIAVVDFQMEEDIQKVEGVLVETKAVRNSELSLITMQKKSAVTLDGIAASQISKSGDSDVAEALKRVTGVTVEGGKYVYVRGLGDRYSQTLVNNAVIPSLDPLRNSVQLDVFPTALIDNIIVYKTFAPNLPGNFVGGLVNIATKDFPGELTLSFNTKLGYNTNSTFINKFLTYEGGKTDWLGIDDGNRSIPYLSFPIPEYTGTSMEGIKSEQLTNATRSFSNNFNFQRTTAFFDHSHSLAVGNQTAIGKIPIGYYVGLSYQRNFSYDDDSEVGRYKLSGKVSESRGLVKQLQLTEETGEIETLMGALTNVSFRLPGQNKITINSFYNVKGIDAASHMNGKKPSDDVDLFYQTRSLEFDQRSLLNTSIRGQHVVPKWSQFTFDWHGSYSKSVQDQPDLRYFTNGYRIDDDTTFSIEPSIGQLPTRYYRNMKEENFDFVTDLKFDFFQWDELKSELKIGGRYTTSNREFRENQFRYDSQVSSFSGDVTEYIGNVWENGATDGVYIFDAYYARNNYDGKQNILGVYAMANMPLSSKLKAVLGARYELTEILLKSFDESVEDAILKTNDILPSINFNYSLKENMNLRLAFSNTIARPSFREIAKFASFDFVGDFVLVGNPELERTFVYNADARWEFYPNFGELISLSMFYKSFSNHIERAFNPRAANPELFYRNSETAYLIGTEVEIRKNLSFISPKFENISMTANFTYNYSRTDINGDELQLIREDDPEANDFRVMFGQSPFSMNTLLSYQNKKGTNANISFNIMGKRLAYIIVGATPNVYESPRPTLNLNIGHEFEKGISLKFSAKNIANASNKYIQEFKGKDYVYSEYNPGVSFALGISYQLTN